MAPGTGRADRDKPVRAVIYTRVSKDRSGTARSCEEQETECRKWVARHAGWLLHERIYTDNDRSASRFARREREQWPELMEALEAGQFDVLVVWEPSRATRDRKVWAALAAVCEAANVRIAANGNVFDLDDPEQAFQLDLFFALAARESAVTRKRVKRTMTAQAQAGRPHGQVAYGYRRIYDAGTGAFVKQVPDEEPREVIAANPGSPHSPNHWPTKPEWSWIRSDGPLSTYTEAGVVRQLFAWLLAGVPLIIMERRLNAAGIPRPRDGGSPWRRGVIRKVLLNAAYAGKRVHNGTVTAEQCWPPLVDEETFHAAGNLLRDPMRTTTRPSRAKYLLSYLARCEKCGGHLCARPPGARRGGALTYCCFGEFCGWVDAADMDDYVSLCVTRWLSTTDLPALLRADDASEEVVEARGKLERWRGELKEWEARLDDPDTEIDPSVADRRIRTLRKAVKDAEERSQRTVPAPLRSVNRDDSAERVRAWVDMELPARREFLRLAADIRLAPQDRTRRNIPIEERVSITWLLGEDHADEASALRAA